MDDDRDDDGDAQAVLTMRGVRKTFPGVTALDGVDFRLLPGEVHALMGENGAGKSTLIKVLTGVHRRDGGTVRLDGADLEVTSPQEAQAAGISTVYQEVNLCPNLSVAENLFIGREPRRFGRIQWGEMRRRTRDLLARLDLDLDPGSALSSHSIAVQQLVAIARAIDVSARVLVLDEPTSSLDAEEVQQLFRVVRQLRDEGVAVLFVSHFLDQVYEIADRMTVLRNGKLVGEYRTAELSQVQLVTLMIGKELEVLEELEEQPVRDPEELRSRPVVTRAHGLGRTGSVEPLDLTLHSGEVLGLAGLLGSGRTETVRLLFGADRADSGDLEVNGTPGLMRSPVAAIRHGMAFCPEDRKVDGILAELSVRENVVLAMQAARGWMRPIPRRRQDAVARKYIEALDIRPADPEMPAGHLSGGNQQKVLLARWLATEPTILILDEPTRGIDVGAKAEIQQLVAGLSRDGMAVLFISAELEEVLRLADTVAVLRDRTLVAQLDNTDLTQETVMELIASGAPA
ncbi:sugar ABC transporter ATP-binding protein [Spongisporangium articulatum]|uniref:Sugar ABC transporter ATP-binding protein n=1 Tax=Spongisporangium articulatum TaxID=3362603 RepID=A0ABW8AL84_9ACTN